MIFYLLFPPAAAAAPALDAPSVQKVAPGLESAMDEQVPKPRQKTA